MKILLTSLLLLSIWFCGQAADFSTSTKEASKAMGELKQIKHFAFGGVGIAGKTSGGELAFITIYGNANAKNLFQEVSEQGTSAAKLYALVALRRLISEVPSSVKV